jgi:hypothetical protein
MFIVWGSKVVHRKLGYAADFCYICRCSSVFSVRRIGMAGHVYYISAGEGKLVGFDRTCQKCNIVYTADPSAYTALAKKSDSVDALITHTFPNFETVWQERLALENRLNQNVSLLSLQERKALLAEPFVKLSPGVEARFASTHLDKEVWYAILGAIAAILLLPPLVKSIAPDQAEPFLLTAIAVGLLAVIWQIAISGKRYMRREILPALADALQPLHPLESEISAILADLKNFGHKIGSKLLVADILLQLNSKKTNNS